MKQIEIPTGARYIVVYEVGNKLAVSTGGFQNFDEMIGFNRRVINPNLTEQIMVDAINRQMGSQPQVMTEKPVEQTPTKL